MKIAIDVSPLQTGHKVRGVGFYLKHLKNALEENFPEHEYLFFTEKNELSKGIDVVHYPYFDPFFVTLPLVKRYPTVVTVHDLTPLVFPEHFPAGIKGKLRWQIQKKNLKNVDMVIADSEASKRDIVKLAGIPASKVAVTYLAAGKEFRQRNMSKSEFADLQHKYNLPDKFILYVGDVTWNKNLPNLAQAAIQSAMPLVMVGKSLIQKEYDRANPWNKDLVTIQRLAEGNPNILRLGFVPTEDLIALYNSAALFIMPSHYEGFGLPIIEAMKSGCPVITTKNGSLPEVAGDAAIYVNANDVDSIKEGITKVNSDDKLRQEMSLKGLARAKEFNWKITASETINVYKQVVK